jgi:hypothetical protein
VTSIKNTRVAWKIGSERVRGKLIVVGVPQDSIQLNAFPPRLSRSLNRPTIISEEPKIRESIPGLFDRTRADNEDIY